MLPPVVVNTPAKEKPKAVLLPQASRCATHAVNYLIRRGIEPELIYYCISTGRLYESYPHHNVVFVGLDKYNKPRYANLRGIGSDFKGEANGSDKRFSFSIPAKDSDTVHLFESAIDLLSYATIRKQEGMAWNGDHLVSLAGVYAPREKIEESKVPAAVEGFLKSHPDIKRIVLHFDNDEVGRKATQALQIILSDRYEVIDSPPKFGKDFNDFLCMKLGIYKSKQRSFER